MEKFRLCGQNKVPKKNFLKSKWTAVAPRNHEKHFLAKGEIRKSDRRMGNCVLEAVCTKRIVEVDWAELNNSDLWLKGWR